MKNILICLIMSFFIIGRITADEPPIHITEVISQNNQYKLNLINTINDNDNFIEYWELIRINTNEIIYNFICYQFTLTGKLVFISDNGNNISIIDWFLPVDWRNANRQNINNKIVIKFYFLGNEINSYRLSDIFNNIRRGIQSVSHFQWTNYNQNRNSILMNNNQLIIRTLESYEYIFNINNGEIINRRRI